MANLHTETPLLLPAPGAEWEQLKFAVSPLRQQLDEYWEAERIRKKHADRVRKVERRKLYGDYRAPLPSSPTFAVLAEMLGAKTAQELEGLNSAYQSLSMFDRSNFQCLKGITAFDICAGSAIPAGDYTSPDNLERHSPWFSRLTHFYGAAVTALDYRPQVVTEPFASVQLDITDLPTLRQTLKRLGSASLINAKGFPKFPNQKIEAEIEMLLRQHLIPGGQVIYSSERHFVLSTLSPQW